MAAKEKILDALDELVTITAEHERGQPAYYSNFARQHLGYWDEALRHSPDLIEIDVDELGARVADVRRLLGRHPEDVEHAIIDAFSTSVRLYRGLPGGHQVPPPMPKPKPRTVPAHAFDQ